MKILSIVQKPCLASIMLYSVCLRVSLKPALIKFGNQIKTDKDQDMTRVPSGMPTSRQTSENPEEFHLNGNERLLPG